MSKLKSSKPKLAIGDRVRVYGFDSTGKYCFDGIDRTVTKLGEVSIGFDYLGATLYVHKGQCRLKPRVPARRIMVEKWEDGIWCEFPPDMFLPGERVEFIEVLPKGRRKNKKE